jgi:hypothetical protein
MSALLNTRLKLPKTKIPTHIKTESADGHHVEDREDNESLSPKSQSGGKDSGQAAPHAFNEKDQTQPILIQSYQTKKLYCTSIDEVPVTVERKVYVPNTEEDLKDAGTARAAVAASRESPFGTTEGNWAAEHQHQTVR